LCFEVIRLHKLHNRWFFETLLFQEESMLVEAGLVVFVVVFVVNNPQGDNRAWEDRNGVGVNQGPLTALGVDKGALGVGEIDVYH
jgi:hypothetical protein